MLEESGSPTPQQPVQDSVENTISAVADRLGANIAGDPIIKSKPLKPSIITTNRSGPLKSIVEDLKVKVYIRHS